MRDGSNGCPVRTACDRRPDLVEGGLNNFLGAVTPAASKTLVDIVVGEPGAIGTHGGFIKVHHDAFAVRVDGAGLLLDAHPRVCPPGVANLEPAPCRGWLSPPTVRDHSVS